MKTSKELYKKMLDLGSDWEVSSVNLDLKKKEVEIHLSHHSKEGHYSSPWVIRSHGSCIQVTLKKPANLNARTILNDSAQANNQHNCAPCQGLGLSCVRHLYDYWLDLRPFG